MAKQSNKNEQEKPTTKTAVNTTQENRSENKAKTKPSKPQVDPRVDVGKWKDLTKYACKLCKWSTTDYSKMVEHLRDYHSPKHVDRESKTLTDRFGNPLKY